jgi:hypothetical protein
MIDKKNMTPVDKVYPQAKSIKSNTKEEVIALAHKVASALKRERDNLVKEQRENNSSSGFFSTSAV